MGEKHGFLPYPKGFQTAVCHYAQEPEQWSSSAIVAPISTTVGFKLNGPDVQDKTYITSLLGNPTIDILEKLLAHLENAKFGACFPSGSAATATCLALLDKDEHVICLNDVYGGTRKQLRNLCARYEITTSYVDGDPKCFEEAVQTNSKMIWIESPTNPSLQVIDIEAIAKIAKKHNLILVVDNTFLTPYLQRPLDFGATISLHSVSKYLNGHTDVIMGALLTNDATLFAEIQSIQKGFGFLPSPFDCYQVLRGLKTLPVRMRQQGESSLRIAKFLETQPKIEKVIHPGLPSHPKHELSKKQTSGSSGMITFYVKGELKTTEKFIKSLKIIAAAGSLGGYNSVMELPTVMSHFSVPVEDKKKLRYTDNMIRFSVGLEDPEDLIEDIRNALQAI